MLTWNPSDREAFFRDARKVVPAMPIPRAVEAHNLKVLNNAQGVETAVGTHAVAAEPVETRLLHYLVKNHGGFGVWITDGSMPLSDDHFNGWHGPGGTIRLTEIAALCREPATEPLQALVEEIRQWCDDVYSGKARISAGARTRYERWLSILAQIKETER